MEGGERYLNSKKSILFITVLILFSLTVAACAVTKQPPSNEGKSSDLSPSDKAPTEEEKEEQTPKNDENPDGPTTAQNAEDGEYEGRTEKDERGNYGVAKITVNDGRITEAEYTEYTDDDKPKSREGGYDYEQALNAFEDLPDILIEKQDVNNIDTYAGATGTTKTFKAAVMKALEKAAKKSS